MKIEKYGEITREQILADDLSDIEEKIRKLQAEKQILCQAYLQETGAGLCSVSVGMKQFFPLEK